jgi:mRNA interferase HigB
MLIENRTAIERFTSKHADSRVPFAEWIEKVEAAQWSDPVDVKSTFNSVDYVKGLAVFNVGGNNFRVVAEIAYKDRVVRIAKVGKHSDYDGWKL